MAKIPRARFPTKEEFKQRKGKLAETPVLPFFPPLTPKRLMQFEAPLERRFARLPTPVQTALPITHVPSYIGEEIKQYGRLMAGKPTAWDILTMPLFIGGLKAKPLPKVKPPKMKPSKVKIPKIDLLEQKLKLQRTKEMAQAAVEEIQRNPQSRIVLDKSRRLFRRIASAFEAGEIQPQDIPQILKKYNMTPEEFANIYRDTISTAGRQLKELSDVAKEINKLYPEIELPVAQRTTWDNLKELYRRIDRVRRGMLVGQLATAMRNAISQAGRYTLQIAEDALTGAQVALTGKAPLRKAFIPLMEDIFALGRALRNKKRLAKIFDEFPLEKVRLYGRPVAEAHLGLKATRIINAFNTAQEYFFRNLAFDAYITSQLRLKGLDPANVSQIPSSIIRKGVNHALEITFAKYPTTGFANTVMRLYRDLPFLTALGNPFPRFWANSLKFLFDYSPGGFARLLSPKFLKKLVSKNPQVAMQSLSKATLGTLMLSAALAIRNSRFAGDKWYDIKTSEGKRIDTRAFAPFSTYLFLAEAMSHPERLTGFDWLQGAVGINRIAGTGLIIVDILRSQKAETTLKLLKQFLGEYLGGFTVPFRTLSDIIGQFEIEERTYRATREYPLIGPFLANIPFAQRLLPPSPRITRKEPYRREVPLLRQLTGLTVKTRNFLEREMERLRIRVSTQYPRTGNPKLNRYIAEKMGPAMEVISQRLEKSKKYQKLSDIEKEDFIKDAFRKVRRVAKQRALKQYEDELAEDYRQLLQGKTREEKIRILRRLKRRGVITKEIARKALR